MKIDRLMGIVMQLINHDKRTARQLAAYFDVSVRTIKRDMDTLTLAGLPIYADVGSSGGYQLMEHFKIRQNFLKKGEAQILMTLLNGLADAVPTAEMHAVADKFSSLHHDIALSDSLVIQPAPLAGNSAYLRNRIASLSAAIEARQKVAITYISQSFSQTTRTIHPYTLVLMSNQWYLYAHCELRGEFRLFKLFRIHSFQVTPDDYIPRQLPDKKPWQGEYDARLTTEVKIRLDRILLGKLPDYIDFKMCQMTPDGIVVTLSFPVDEWFYSFLMGFVPHIQILSPPHVQAEFVKRLKHAIDKNSQ